MSCKRANKYATHDIPNVRKSIPNPMRRDSLPVPSRNTNAHNWAIIDSLYTLNDTIYHGMNTRATRCNNITSLHHLM